MWEEDGLEKGCRDLLGEKHVIYGLNVALEAHVVRKEGLCSS